MLVAVRCGPSDLSDTSLCVTGARHPIFAFIGAIIMTKAVAATTTGNFHLHGVRPRGGGHLGLVTLVVHRARLSQKRVEYARSSGARQTR